VRARSLLLGPDDADDRSSLRFLRRVLLGIGAQFMQQLCGINLITYYAPGTLETICRARSSN
jgi:hypothetical protein